MPKSCADCVKNRSLWSHKCIRHSSLCVDNETGLWNPSACHDCFTLFEQAKDGEDAAVEALRAMEPD